GERLAQVISELWYMSARPDETASKDSNAPTNWPAANTLTFNRPPDNDVIASATRSAPDCRPGKFLGHVVTILSSRTPCAIAGLGKAARAAAAPMPAPSTNWRRSMIPSRLAVRAASGTGVFETVSAGMPTASTSMLAPVQGSASIYKYHILRGRVLKPHTKAPNYRWGTRCSHGCGPE